MENYYIDALTKLNNYSKIVEKNHYDVQSNKNDLDQSILCYVMFLWGVAVQELYSHNQTHTSFAGLKTHPLHRS